MRLGQGGFQLGHLGLGGLQMHLRALRCGLRLAAGRKDAERAAQRLGVERCPYHHGSCSELELVACTIAMRELQQEGDGNERAEIQHDLIFRRDNGHLNPYQYLSVLLTELPQVTCVEDVERMLPWNLLPEQVGIMFGAYPLP